LAYPFLRQASWRLVDRVVLRRPDYDALRREIGGALTPLEKPDAVLDAVCARLGPALYARRVWWQQGVVEEERGVTTVTVPTSEPPPYTLVVEDLAEGRRLLSDDLALLDAIAVLTARRLDALRLVHERCQRDLREQEITALAAEAELRALRAQLNPHFLFNALNTLSYLMRTAPARALDTLLELTHLLRAVLRRSDGDFVTLGQEMELVESYLAIEAVRFEERLRVRVDVPLSLRSLPVPPLVLQPLVENAIKHGIARKGEGGTVSVTARLDDEDGERLRLVVADSGTGASRAELEAGRRTGLGLTNVERRIDLYYVGRASLEVASQPGLGTTVTLRLPASTPSSATRAGRVARERALV
jgi:signal transduction histidine kinase